jgi:hypothetical protein
MHTPWQAIVPAPQTQRPSPHCSLGAHFVPHPPQSSGLLLVSTQAPLQLVKPGVHCEAQAPALQSGVVPEHVRPQAPQLRGSV